MEDDLILPEEICLDDSENEDWLYIYYLDPREDENARREYAQVCKIIHEVEKETGVRF